MNRSLLLAAVCIFGMQSISFAQDTITTTTAPKTRTKTITITENDGTYRNGFYAGFGVVFIDNIKLNDKLRASDMPTLTTSMPEFSIGFTHLENKVLVDLEWNTNYYGDRSNATTKTTTLSSGVKLRGQYAIVSNKKFFFAGGLDIAYMYTQFDMFSRDHVIDLNDLDPATHTGHISLKNGLLYAGPSVSLGAFQNSSFPLRLNAGYEWAIAGGKWKSDFAHVSNTVKENGSGRVYVKLTVFL